MRVLGCCMPSSSCVRSAQYHMMVSFYAVGVDVGSCAAGGWGENMSVVPEAPTTTTAASSEDRSPRRPPTVR